MECFPVFANGIDGRIDPFYYKLEFRELVKSIKENKFGFVRFGEIIQDISSGATPKIEGDFYSDSGIPFLRVQNITEEGLNLNDVKFIKEGVHQKMLKRSQLHENELVYTITGRIGSVAVVPKDFEGNINQHSVRIKLKDKINEIKILPEYIALFFNLKSGQRLTLRSTTGGTRPALDYTAIKDLILTLPKFEKQKEILEKIKQAYSQRKQKEAKAQQLLDSINDYVLDELGIKFSPMIEDKTYSINSEELETNRSDPYYFNPKFKRLLADLKKSEIKLVSLKDVAKELFNGKTPAKENYAEEGNFILKVRCLKNNKIVWDKLSFVKDTVPLVKTVKDKDILLLSSAHQSDYLGKNPSIVEKPNNLTNEKIYFVGELINIRLNIEKINPYYLLAILKEYKSAEQILAASEEFEKELIAMQDNFYNVRLTYNSAQRWRERFYAHFCSLASSIGQSDFPPTTQQVEVHEMFKKRLASYKGQFNELIDKDLDALNNMLKEENIKNIIAKTP